MAFIPEQVEWRKASQENNEANYRFTQAAKDYTEVLRDKSATPEQRQSAVERYNAAFVDAKIASERVRIALGGEGSELKTESKDVK